MSTELLLFAFLLLTISSPCRASRLCGQARRAGSADRTNAKQMSHPRLFALARLARTRLYVPRYHGRETNAGRDVTTNVCGSRMLLRIVDRRPRNTRAHDTTMKNSTENPLCSDPRLLFCFFFFLICQI